MSLHNPLDNPDFLPSLRIIASLFGLGLLLVFYFARKDLVAGLKGELGQRYFSWMIIAPAFLIATFVGGAVAAAILVFFFYRVALEYVRVCGVERSYAIYLYALIPVTFVVAALAPTFYFTLPAASILLLTLIPILTGKVENLNNQLSYAGRGYLYLVWSIGHIVLLKDIVGDGLIVMLGAAIALSDVMQYTIGKLLGKHIISPNVNPRKAWEGLIGDFLGAALVIYLFDFVFPPEFALVHKLTLAFIVGLGSAWGDLLSSLAKRVAGTKDWGAILPGHGGLLDRANSMVVALPLAYYFILFVLRTAI